MVEDLHGIHRSLADRYTIESEIGRGGMATVYLAGDVRHDRKVAVKVLRPALSASLGADRFKREITIAAKLSHPHIVPLYDSGEAGGYLYYVMPFVEGETLREALDREGPFSLDRALTVAHDVAEGLEYAHGLGIVHRDIKPQNILLTAGHAVIADFGIARALEAAATRDLTTSGLVLGTPAYMSPEQAIGEEGIDGRADLYSLACVLYEMLAGQPPYDAKSVHALIARHVQATVPSPEELRPDLPHGVAEAIQRALAKSPDERFSSVAAFVETLDRTVTEDVVIPAPGIARTPREWTTRTRVLATAVAVVGVAAIVYPVGRALLGGRGEPAFVGSPESVVVLPFHTSASDERERDAAADLAAAITRELNNWESIRAVPRVSLAGPMFDLGLRGATLEFVDDGLDVAADLGVQALVAITLSLTGDTAQVEANLFDAGTGESVGRPWQSRGHAADIASLVAPIARGILELGGATVALDELRLRSAVPEALQQEAEGRRLLERWRLEEAERSFREAIASDSTFAMALHRLSQTLYWQAARNLRSLIARGLEVARTSAAALRHSTGLPSQDSLHIRAFYAFQEGDYVTARELYDVLLSRDATDVYAWLMLGSVEYRDPWLAGVEDAEEAGSLAPRGDLNRAVRAFSETLRLQPTFDLGYGHLFDIHRLVTAANRGQCPGFELPRAGLLAPWDPQTPLQARAFCPVWTDSIEWVSWDVFNSSRRSTAAAGADQLFDQSFRLLRRWAAYAPTEVKPREEIVGALLEQRNRLDVASPSLIDSMTREARTVATEALALKSDTLPDDLLALGGLYLGTGDVAEAHALTEQALSMYTDAGEAPPPYSANVFLATGHPSRALALVAGPGPQRWIPDPVGDRLIPYGGAEPIVNRIAVLGATGVAGVPLDAALQALLSLWSEPRYSARDNQLLRQDAAFRVAAALAPDPEALESWDEGLSVDQPLWRALLASPADSAAGARLLVELLQTDVPHLRRGSSSYLKGLVASKIGDHAQAVRLFSRMDSIPLRLDALDFGWGLRNLSLFRRAVAYEALQDTDRALRHYERLSQAWATADSLAMPLVERARSSAARLRGES
jgi:tetratricopeptide (TPR) repeat protein/tRNA A-37 threonylcarbamoyl transferase component Bud32